MSDTKKIGICLSGGGARGIAHIGVIKALEEHHIFPNIISGASAGSIVGALYAAGKTPTEMLQFSKDSSLLRLFRPGFPFSGLADLTYLTEQLAKQIDKDSFEALKKELYISVCNLNTGRPEIISSGQLFDVVKASSSIPTVFKAVQLNKQTYVDGGLMNNFPSEVLKDKCDFIIGVNVMPHLHIEKEEINSLIEIATRSFELTIWNNTQPNLQYCNIIIEPKALTAYHVFNFSKAQEIYEIGYNSAIEVIPEILEKIL